MSGADDQDGDIGGSSGYRSYLLTCWQERDAAAGTGVWRYRLERSTSGRSRILATFEEVMSIIEGELHDHSNPPGTIPSPGALIKETVEMAEVHIVTSARLKPGVDRAEFEHFLVHEFNPRYEEMPGLTKAILLREKEDGGYIGIITYESQERYDQLWPSWGEAGEETRQWIAANQALWDKVFTYCEVDRLSDGTYYYVEVD